MGGWPNAGFDSAFVVFLDGGTGPMVVGAITVGSGVPVVNGG
jgi:hypothetical protein